MSEIFKAYDIRGLYPEEVNEDIAYKIGRAFVKSLRCKNVVIGMDMRDSCKKLFSALAKGINEQGADVINIGMCTTPMFYFCVANYKYDAGIMITASHNPAKYNGFKLVRKQAIPIGQGSGMEKIKRLSSKDFKKAKKEGSIIKKDFVADYVNHALKFNNMEKAGKRLKIVIDYGNGMGSLETDNVLKGLNLNMIGMYKKPDGNFPNHEANPIKPENVRDLKQRVAKEKADLGVAFDGDCDRIGFIDEKGEAIPGDMITALIAKALLKRYPKSTILYDLRSSWVTKEAIEEVGGRALKSRVGHAFIKKQMRKKNAVFAGELSCHFYFKDNFYAESSIGALLTVLSMLSSSAKSMSELVKPLKRYFKSEEINSEVADKEAKIKELAKRYRDAKISWLDGMTAEYKDWWFNIRQSNTEPLLRLNLEAKSKNLMESKIKEVLNIINL
jgi:phosphomannomutase